MWWWVVYMDRGEWWWRVDECGGGGWVAVMDEGWVIVVEWVDDW